MTEAAVLFEGSDEELRALCLRDRNQGWLCLESRYGRTIRWRIATFREFSREDAQDVYQNVSLHLSKDAYRILQKWDPQKSSLGLFLSVVTANQCKDYLRSGFYKDTKRSRVAKTEDSDETDPLDIVPSAGPSPADAAVDEELEAKISETIEKWAASGDLKIRDRLLLEGRLYHGINFDELSKTLRMKPPAAMKQVSRLKADLRERLKREGIDTSAI